MDEDGRASCMAEEAMVDMSWVALRGCVGKEGSREGRGHPR